MFYVGRTHDIQERMKNHISKILNFKPFLSKFECVPFHFSLKGHIVNRDFSFFILESNIDDVNLIKTKEAFYINFVYKIDKKIIINDFIPAIFFRK